MRIIVNQVKSDLQKWALDLIVPGALSSPITLHLHLQWESESDSHENKNGQLWILPSRPQIHEPISSSFRPNSYNKLVHYKETYGNKMLFIFSMKIRVILQKVNEMTLEICSSTFWIRIVKRTGHVNMNSITFGKFEDSIWAVVIVFAWTTQIIMSKINFIWSIHINICAAATRTIN